MMKLRLVVCILRLLIRLVPDDYPHGPARPWLIVRERGAERVMCSVKWALMESARVLLRREEWL